MADDRVSKLRALEELTLESIRAADPDKRSALIGQYRAILAELAELSGDVAASGSDVQRTGLSDFERRLAERQSGAHASGRSASRR